MMSYSVLSSVHFSTVYTPSQSTIIAVNTNQSGLPVQDVVEATDVLLEHASASSCLWSADTGRIFARVINDRRTLELIQASDDSSPVQFSLSSRIVGTPGLTYEEASTSLHVLVLTEARSLYRLSFPLPRLFNSAPLPRTWCKEYVVRGLTESSDGPFHVVNPTTVLIGMRDGTVLRVEQTKATNPVTVDGLASFYDENWTETILRPSSIYNALTSLIPFTSTQTSATESPAQVLSLDSYVQGDLSELAFSVSRDLRLRIWSLSHGACVRQEDLPPFPTTELAVASYSPPKRQKLALLSSEPRRLVRVVPAYAARGSDEAGFIDAPSCVLVFVPSPTSPVAGGFFVLYNVTTSGSTGQFNGLSRVGHKICSKATARSELRDFMVANGRIWALWDQQGSPLLESSPLDMDKFVPDSALEWVSVDAQAMPDLSSAVLDDRISALPSSLARTYLGTLLAPDFFSPITLDSALRHYSEQLISQIAQSELPPQLSRPYNTVGERIAGIVGCSVPLEKDEQTGAWLWDEHRDALKREWETFAVGCTEIERAARWPLSLSAGMSNEVIVMDRERFGVVVSDDAAMDLRERSSAPPHDKEAAVIKLLHAARLLSGLLPSTVRTTFAHDLLSTIRSPITSSSSDICSALYDRLFGVLAVDDVESVSQRVQGLPNPSGAFIEAIEVLTSIGHAPGPAETRKEGELHNAIVTSYLSSTIRARFETAIELGLLIIMIMCEKPDLISDVGVVCNDLFSSLHCIGTLAYLSQQPAGGPPRKNLASSLEDDFAARFGNMRVTADKHERKLRISITYSLLHSLLPEMPPATDIRTSVHAFLSGLGVLRRRQEISALTSDVVLLNDLRTAGHLAVVKNVAGWYPRSPAVCYVLGRTLLDMKDGDEAAEVLEGVATAFAFDSTLTAEDADAVSRLFPVPRPQANPSFCYRQMASWFEQAGFHSSAVKFWKRAIELSNSQNDVRDLWYKISAAQIGLNQFEDAYMTLIVTPDKEERENTIRKLVDAMCIAGEADKMTRMSFAGLQGSVEEFLEFKARNHDPLESPQYSEVLYAWHVFRGNYRSAGSAMYHHGRRLAAKHAKGVDYAELGTQQARCYLAAINCMSLIEPRHAWVASTLADGDTPGSNHRNLMQDVPEGRFTPGTKHMEIVELQDIRREYALALARLELVQMFPDLGGANFSLSASDAVALFAQSGSFDSAFSTAASLQVDMTSLFQNLTSRCVDLSRQGEVPEQIADSDWLVDSFERVAAWEGSSAEKAWRYLRLVLDRHDRADTDYRYRKAVLEKVLELDRRNRLPSWLVKFFEEHHPEYLIRTCLQYGLVKEAASYTLSMIRRSNNKLGPMSRKQASTTWLPYGLIDQVIDIAQREEATRPLSGMVKQMVLERVNRMEKQSRMLVK